jgi:hypothetical protein
MTKVLQLQNLFLKTTAAAGDLLTTITKSFIKFSTKRKKFESFNFRKNPNSQFFKTNNFRIQINFKEEEKTNSKHHICKPPHIHN